jgi:hypothetical protein
MRRPRSTRGTEIMASVREMSARGATPQEIAHQVRTSHGHVIQAIRVLRDAPDLAAKVERGQISLIYAYRALTARRMCAPAAAFADLSGHQDTRGDVQGRSSPVRDRPARST